MPWGYGNRYSGHSEGVGGGAFLRQSAKSAVDFTCQRKVRNDAKSFRVGWNTLKGFSVPKNKIRKKRVPQSLSGGRNKTMKTRENI